MATIHASETTITQINVFEVEKSKQDELTSLLMEAVRCVSGMPGWVSASIHRSLDGTRVTNYAQAVDHASWEKIVEKLQSDGFFARFQKLAKPNPCLYRCVFSLSSD